MSSDESNPGPCPNSTSICPGDSDEKCTDFVAAFLEEMKKLEESLALAETQGPNGVSKDREEEQVPQSTGTAKQNEAEVQHNTDDEIREAQDEKQEDAQQLGGKDIKPPDSSQVQLSFEDPGLRRTRCGRAIRPTKRMLEWYCDMKLMKAAASGALPKKNSSKKRHGIEVRKS